MRPVADRIYAEIFSGISVPERFDKPDNMVLDKEFAIDVRLTFPCGLTLTGQEKFLTCKQATFRTVTAEYEQNQDTHERGDWYKLAVQFYFVGYSTNDNKDFYPWVLLDWPQVVIATHQKRIRWNIGHNQHDGARASFKYCQMDTLPKECIIASSL